MSSASSMFRYMTSMMVPGTIPQTMSAGLWTPRYTLLKLTDVDPEQRETTNHSGLGYIKFMLWFEQDTSIRSA